MSHTRLWHSYLFKLTEHRNIEWWAYIIIIYEYSCEVLIAKLRLIAVTLNIFKNITLN